MAQRSFPMIAILASVLSVSLFSTGAQATEKYEGKIVKLSDGDTFQFLADGETIPYKVRMMGIDTAEAHLGVPGGIATQGFWADMGSNELAKNLKIGDRAVLEVFGQDKYKRTLGRVFKNGEDINLKMLRSGWASLFVICDKGTQCRTGGFTAQDLKTYREACQYAVTHGLGLFDPSRPVPELPFIFRAQQQRQALSKYVADLSKGTFVEPNAFEDVNICDRLFFLSQDDVTNNGFKRK